MLPTLIFSGTQAEASQFARQANLKHGFTVISQPYHLQNIERGSTLVVVGSWERHPQRHAVYETARARQMPIQTEAEFLRRLA